MLKRLFTGFIYALIILGIYTWLKGEPEKQYAPSAQVQQPALIEAAVITDTPEMPVSEIPEQNTEIPQQETLPPEVSEPPEFSMPSESETSLPETIEPIEVTWDEPSPFENYSEEIEPGNFADAESPEPATDDSVVYAILDSINAERRLLGLGELEYDSSLSDLSAIRCAEMFEYGYFGHTRPNGDKWWTILEDEDSLIYEHASENIAQTEYSTVYEQYNSPVLDGAYWFNQWKNSEPHYETMISDKFTHVGISTFYGIKYDQVYQIAASIFASYR